MAPSRMEINLQRLLVRCEAMAGDYQEKKECLNWRLEKYVCALQNNANELSKSASKPSQDAMSDYTKRVEFLKGLVETEKAKSTSDKAVTSHHLSRSSAHASLLSDRPPADRVQELHLKTKSRLDKEMRDELLRTESKTDVGGVRNRRAGNTDNEGKEESIDAVLQYHQNMQEKIAEEMVLMAQNMKHTSMMAQNIIHKDKQVLEASTRLADCNLSKLKHEADRLEEIANRRCSLWMWIALSLVMAVFIMTILFIKMFPKRT
ncbi:vesicle transport protein USE1 [Nematostella vectensis]|uniref:vesicle transport protein USE1 n=1 Tax=Nematostella vectensis TaxID=45351 RepID=UPI00138FEB45|nr:vesicle transport protein USE1 [Nematostella vectensis]